MLRSENTLVVPQDSKRMDNCNFGGSPAICDFNEPFAKDDIVGSFSACGQGPMPATPFVLADLDVAFVDSSRILKNTKR